MGLQAARTYARIAPASSHARHMPSHVFLPLGLWDEAAASDESSFAASVDRVKRLGLSMAQADFHSLSWLHYEYLQQGRFAKAREVEETVRKALASAPGREQDRTGPAPKKLSSAQADIDTPSLGPAAFSRGGACPRTAPSGCSAKSACHGPRLRARRGAPFAATRERLNVIRSSQLAPDGLQGPGQRSFLIRCVAMASRGPLKADATCLCAGLLCAFRAFCVDRRG